MADRSPKGYPPFSPGGRAAMTAFRSAFALISALAAAPAPAQNAPLIPILKGPAAPGQCVIGSAGCGLAGAMDPIAEGALVGLGQRAVLSLDGDVAERSPAAKKAPPVAPPRIADDPDADAGADLIAIGGQIINPLPATTQPRVASAQAAPARLTTFDTRVDASPISGGQVPKATGLSYFQSQKVEATLKGKGAAFGNDPKLSAGDADFAPGGFRATSNGSR
jgi:hypothetical protein